MNKVKVGNFMIGGDEPLTLLAPACSKASTAHC